MAEKKYSTGWFYLKLKLLNINILFIEMMYKLNITRIIASNISMAVGFYFYSSKVALSYLMGFNCKQALNKKNALLSYSSSVNL